MLVLRKLKNKSDRYLCLILVHSSNKMNEVTCQTWPTTYTPWHNNHLLAIRANNWPNLAQLSVVMRRGSEKVSVEQENDKTWILIPEFIPDNFCEEI